MTTFLMSLTELGGHFFFHFNYILFSLRSLEKNSYDHITATYYLLIERRLRKHQQQQDQLLHSSSSGLLRKQSEPSPSRQAKPHLEPLMLSPRYAHNLDKHYTFLVT